VLVTSRSLVEYRAMFALTEHDVAGPLLDCCAGAAGLVAEASAAGGRAVAADPVFAQGVERVAAAVRESLAGGQQLIDDHAGQFVWDWYGTRDRRDAMRAEAARLFLADLGHRPDRYIAAELPRLPFVDNAFDLALCSHLLFTWARRWDESWHRTALRELARVAHEARVFPLVRAGDGSPAPFLTSLVDSLRAEGFSVEIRRVEYEFQRGGNEMLIVRG